MNGEKGLLVVFTGEGKGKTTAALGMAMRAKGHGFPVIVFQFIKGGWSYGELRSFEEAGIPIKPLGTGFTWTKENLEEDRRLAEAGWKEAAAEIRGGRHRMVILDELNIVLSYGLLPIAPVLEEIRSRPDGVHVVVTGRNAPPELVEAADLVSEMRKIKHPYSDKGLKAQKGIEY